MQDSGICILPPPCPAYNTVSLKFIIFTLQERILRLRGLLGLKSPAPEHKAEPKPSSSEKFICLLSLLSSYRNQDSNPVSRLYFSLIADLGPVSVVSLSPLCGIIYIYSVGFQSSSNLYF
jgi:hypothetical protein